MTSFVMSSRGSGTADDEVFYIACDLCPGGRWRDSDQTVLVFLSRLGAEEARQRHDRFEHAKAG